MKTQKRMLILRRIVLGLLFLVSLFMLFGPVISAKEVMEIDGETVTFTYSTSVFGLLTGNANAPVKISSTGSSDYIELIEYLYEDVYAPDLWRKATYDSETPLEILQMLFSGIFESPIAMILLALSGALIVYFIVVMIIGFIKARKNEKATSKETLQKGIQFVASGCLFPLGFFAYFMLLLLAIYICTIFFSDCATLFPNLLPLGICLMSLIVLIGIFAYLKTLEAAFQIDEHPAKKANLESHTPD